MRPVVMVLLVIVVAGIMIPISQHFKNPNKKTSEVVGPWRLSYGALFSFGMIVVFGMALLTAMSWPPRARLFPFAIFGPILLLAIANFVKDLRRQPWTETINLAVAEANLDEFSFRKRTRDIVGWVLGFFWRFGCSAFRLEFH